jgi:hypothetical protein
VDLILDASAAIHAAAMVAAGDRLLDRIDFAFQRPCYGLTNAVRTEFGRNGLGDWLADLEQQGRLSIVKNDFRAARRCHEHLRKVLKGKAPGQNDAGLLVLADENRVPLLTDDQGLYHAAGILGVPCADLFDFALAAHDVGSCSTVEIHAWFDQLATDSPNFEPFGWPALRREDERWPEGFDRLRGTRAPIPPTFARLLARKGTAPDGAEFGGSLTS